MKCFNHADRDAVGICKSCGKGICHECLVEIPDAIACKTERCERRSRLCVQIVDSNPAIVNQANKQLKRQSLALLLIGSLFAGLGLLLLIHNPDSWIMDLLLLVMGALFITHGAQMARRKNQYPAAEAK